MGTTTVIGIFGILGIVVAVVAIFRHYGSLRETVGYQKGFADATKAHNEELQSRYDRLYTDSGLFGVQPSSSEAVRPPASAPETDGGVSLPNSSGSGEHGEVSPGTPGEVVQ